MFKKAVQQGRSERRGEAMLRYVEPLSDARTMLADFFSILLSLIVLSSGRELIDLPLRATFSPTHPLANIFHPPHPPIASQSISRDVPLAQARGLQSSSPHLKGVAKAVLHCAHRTSTIDPIDPSKLACFLSPGRALRLVDVRPSNEAINDPSTLAISPGMGAD